MTTPLRKRYQLEGPIGAGAAGVVYLARDLHLPGRRCAVKAVRLPVGAGLAEREAAHAQLTTEAAILARLDHPALPSVSDYFETADAFYLVMDYVPGDDLRAILLDARSRGRHLDVAQILRWADDLCSALSYLHHQAPPVVHRDVKPANVKVTPDGQVRLVDFGLARPLADASGITLTVADGAGSRPYQPLEQYGDGPGVDARSDLYALAATLYHLLTGVAPATAHQRFLAPASLRPVRELRPEVPRHVAAAILAGMALHPDDRPATVQSLRHLLGTAPAAGDGTWPAALRANRILLVALAVMLALALVVSIWP